MVINHLLTGMILQVENPKQPGSLFHCSLAVGPARNFYFGLAIGLALLTGSLCSAKVSGACPLVRVFFFKRIYLGQGTNSSFFVSFFRGVCILCIIILV